MKRCLKCRTENAPDAEYCIKCGFSLFEDAPPADAELRPPTRVVLQVDLEPEVVRLRPGDHAEVVARLPAGPVRGLHWVCAGSASHFATVGPSPEGALVQLHPGRDEQPRALVLEVQCLEHENGEVAGRASGTVEVLAAGNVTPVPSPKPATRKRSGAPGRWKALAPYAGVAALLAAVAAIAVLVFGGSSGVTGQTTSGVCLHTQPAQPNDHHFAPNNDNNCVESLQAATSITVVCVEQVDGADWLELSSPSQFSGDFIFSGFATLNGSPSACS